MNAQAALLTALMAAPALAMESTDSTRSTNPLLAQTSTYALHLACQGRKEDLIQHLLIRHANSNHVINGKTPLMEAIEQEENSPEYQETIRLLIKHATPKTREDALKHAQYHERWWAMELLSNSGTQLTDNDIADGLDLFVQDTQQAAIDVAHSVYEAAGSAFSQLSGIGRSLMRHVASDNTFDAPTESEDEEDSMPLAHKPSHDSIDV